MNLLESTEMNQSTEKKFVIKHAFNYIESDKEDSCFCLASGSEEHFNLHWRINVLYNFYFRKFHFYLTCVNTRCADDWEVETSIDWVVGKKYGWKKKVHYCWMDMECSEKEIAVIPFEEVVVTDGKFQFECHVSIKSSIGVKMNWRSFEDAAAQKFSDVALVVEDKKFYVNKMYLASQSAYFETLFFGDFTEAAQSEIPIQDIDPHDFQNFLEVLHGEPAVGRNSYKGILKLADFFQSPCVTRHCESYLIRESRFTKKEKREAAEKYNLVELKESLKRRKQFREHDIHFKHVWE